MSKSALIFWGGWDGHQPEQVSEIYEKILKDAGYTVQRVDNMDPLSDGEALKKLDLIVPIWTMGEMEKEHTENISAAVAEGTGLAGCHGGMCDAFRQNVLWQFITGGNWVSHPGGDGVEYKVEILNSTSPITDGVSDFKVKSEQYYLHVDPAVEVLAFTKFPVVNWYHAANGPVNMPVAWTKKWGLGRIYYTSLGHHADNIESGMAYKLVQQGTLWAGEGKAYAAENGLSVDEFLNESKMF